MNTSFYVDRTLGKLAKWLRILGLDTACELDDPKPSSGQNECARIRLSRKRCPGDEYPDNWITIESDHLMDQLRQIVKAVHLTEDDVQVFSRCLKCNTPIEKIEKDAALNRVPDYIWETTATFSRCPTCRQIYWAGSHNRRIMKTVKIFFQSISE